MERIRTEVILVERGLHSPTLAKRHSNLSESAGNAVLEALENSQHGGRPSPRLNITSVHGNLGDIPTKGKLDTDSLFSPHHHNTDDSSMASSEKRKKISLYPEVSQDSDIESDVEVGYPGNSSPCKENNKGFSESTSGFSNISSSSLPNQNLNGNLSSSNPDQVRRYRTAFTREQIGRLEKEFYRENYVWFQNRRMKDKRQRLAMTWPHPADPGFYTYMMTHAAATGSLPYPFHSHMPLHYYPHVGVTAAAAAVAATGATASPFTTPIRPLDTFRTLPHPYSRPELICSFRHPGLYQPPAGLNSSSAAVVNVSSSPTPCACLSCHSSQAARVLGSRSANTDFICTATGQRSETGFLPYSASVLSKTTVPSPDPREEASLNR
ncbi:hypothetical protein JZ751_027938 [Albula glossodonta]|uniref:Homeobox domain-containing protein n=1 Tax=Albula glossodonta TaxID=121402 RepID=A0A8T2P7M9_9TELE|nr:hypothetical protein JZ751_027938 [Albula glossodonta]